MLRKGSVSPRMWTAQELPFGLVSATIAASIPLRQRTLKTLEVEQVDGGILGFC